MKTYTFKVTIREGDDEFWESINERNITGCDEVLKVVQEALEDSGFDIREKENLQLVRFEDTDNGK